jgi:hypothetical protein
MLFDGWHDLHISSLFHARNGSALGPEYLMSDSGELSPASGAATHEALLSSLHAATKPPPPPTVVGSPDGLQIDLIWDSSVARAPRGFMHAVADAAKYYTTLFSNHEVINIDVGYGEIDGSTLAANALGESESYGYLTNYHTVTDALAKDGYTFSAANEPTGSQFFVTSADAKTLGLISPTSSAVDGYIGFSTLKGTGYSWNDAANAHGANGGTGPSQFDLESVALHEISEVMGRIGMQGEDVNGRPTYTPLDLFNYQSQGVLELSANGGEFSVNNGTTDLGTYNDAAVNGGDIADWASVASATQSNTLGLPSGVNVYDAYDAFTFPGYNGDVSQSDILEDAALGYNLTPAGRAVS